MARTDQRSGEVTSVWADDTSIDSTTITFQSETKSGRTMVVRLKIPSWQMRALAHLLGEGFAKMRKMHMASINSNSSAMKEATKEACGDG